MQQAARHPLVFLGLAAVVTGLIYAMVVFAPILWPTETLTSMSTSPTPAVPHWQGAMDIDVPPKPMAPTPARPNLTVEMVMGPGVFLDKSPGYLLTIDAKGNVSYAESNHGTFEEKGSATITLEQIDELVAAIEKADVFAMKDSYFVGVYDARTLTLSITLNGQTKTISHYPALECGEHKAIDLPPQALCDLERKIQADVDLYQWNRPLNTPGP